MGVLDATVSVPAAESLLGRPAVEGIAPFPRYNRSQNDLHGGFFSSVLEKPPSGLSNTRPNWHDAVPGLATLVIIRKIVEPARDFAHTPPIARNHGLPGSPVQ
jgi:hypothetical protein